MTPTPRHVGVPHPSALFAVRAASHDSADGARLNHAAPALLASPTCLAPRVEHVLSFRNPSAPRSHFRPPNRRPWCCNSRPTVCTRCRIHWPSNPKAHGYLHQAHFLLLSTASRNPLGHATRHATPPNHRPTGYLTESDPHVPPPPFSPCRRRWQDESCTGYSRTRSWPRRRCWCWRTRWTWSRT